MKNKKQPEFLDVLYDFINEYMPIVAGLSDNTIRLYKATFRLLLRYFQTKQNISCESIRFRDLDRITLISFLNWLESEQNCSIATRNLRLASLSSFAVYAQNRNSDAALIFLAGIRKIPAKKTAICPRVFFTRDEVSVLLRMPDTSSTIGRRDTVLLSLMYASGVRAQEVCDLKVRDVLFQGQTITLTITGKGKKTRRVLRACLTSPRARLGGIFSALTALKILAIRQDCCGFLPCRTKNLSRQSEHAEILNRLLLLSHAQNY